MDLNDKQAGKITGLFLFLVSLLYRLTQYGLINKAYFSGR